MITDGTGPAATFMGGCISRTSGGRPRSRKPHTVVPASNTVHIGTSESSPRSTLHTGHSPATRTAAPVIEPTNRAIRHPGPPGRELAYPTVGDQFHSGDPGSPTCPSGREVGGRPRMGWTPLPRCTHLPVDAGRDAHRSAIAHPSTAETPASNRESRIGPGLGSALLTRPALLHPSATQAPSM